MGTPAPRNPPGVGCALCWGVNSEFGNVQTPKYLILVVRGVRRGSDWQSFMGEPLDGDWTLEQRTNDPCIYEASIFGPQSHFVAYRSFITTVQAKNEAGHSQFRIDSPVICLSSGVNERTQKFIGGTFSVRF